MTIAALYVRKSTDQSDRSDEAKSVARQGEHARAYAVRHGWTVAEDHVYTDDAISGAIFGEKRPGLYRLLNALKPRPPFQVLVVMDQSRLGREQDEIPLVLRRITQAGVRIFCYLTDTEIKRTTSLEKFQANAIAFVDEMHREQGRQRTRDAMLRKARHGHVAGGGVYGYRNVRGADHVERVIEPEQATVVRRIFELCVAGKGLVRTAKLLNAEGVPGPRGRSWAPTAIREMLHRDLYVGRIVYGKTTWVYRDGARTKVDTPATDWITVEAPALRIVPDALWQAAQARLTQSRSAYLRWTGGHLWGRPDHGHESRYLLTGFSQCGVCGGGLSVRTRAGGGLDYRCAFHATRGAAICSNGVALPVRLANAEILGRLQRDVLTPGVVEAAITAALDRFTADAATATTRDGRLRQDLARLEKECTSLVGALAGGEALPSVLDGLRARERQRAALEAELAHVRGLAAATRDRDPRGLRAEIRGWLRDWQGLLEGEPAQARQVLRKLLVGRLVWTPERDAAGTRYTYRAEVSYARVLAGIVGVNGMVPPG